MSDGWSEDGWSEDEHGNPVPISMPTLVDSSSDEEERLTAMHRRQTEEHAQVEQIRMLRGLRISRRRSLRLSKWRRLRLLRKRRIKMRRRQRQTELGMQYSESGPWKVSKREGSMRNAYTNYCRAINHQLYLAMSFKMKTFFNRWASVRHAFWMLDDWTLEHLRWNDDNMKHFLITHVTLEAYHEHRQQESVARRRPSHRFSNRRLPRELTPSLINMWGLTLAALHSESYLGLTSVSPSSHVALPKLRRLQPAIIRILFEGDEDEIAKSETESDPEEDAIQAKIREATIEAKMRAYEKAKINEANIRIER